MSARQAGRRIRQAHRARSTGTLVLIEDTAHPDSSIEPEREETYDEEGRVISSKIVNRWMTVCNDHGFLCTHPTLALARGHAAAPEGWCEECADLTGNTSLVTSRDPR